MFKNSSNVLEGFFVAASSAYEFIGMVLLTCGIHVKFIFVVIVGKIIV